MGGLRGSERRRVFFCPLPSFSQRNATGTTSEAERLIHQDRRQSAGNDRFVDDQEVVDSAGNAVGLPGTQVLKRKAVLVDPSQSGIEVSDDLLTTNNEYDVTRPGNDWPELAPAGGREEQ